MSTWRCEDCGIQIHSDDDPGAKAWTDAFVSDHQAHHAEQLAEYGGDQEALRLHLRNPALAHAIKTVADETIEGES